MRACTSTGVLCEVYAGFTHIEAKPRYTPSAAANGIYRIVEAPSKRRVLGDQGLSTTKLMLSLLEANELRSRKVHDARHAATALDAGVRSVFTYDAFDWRRFEPEGLVVNGPPSALRRLGR